MGYSARYHAFSIIAIFTALAIGIVIGAGYGDDVVSGASEDLERSLAADLEAANAREEELAAELEREREFGLRLYPPLVDGRLEDDRVGVIAFGDLPVDLAREIEETVEPTGADLEKVAVVREPPELDELGVVLGPKFENLPADAAQERLGRILGRQLVEGGRLVDRARDQLLERFSGSGRPVNAAFLAKAPVEGEAEGEAAFASYEEAVIEGIRSTDAATVAVELSTADPSHVPLFDAQQISTVDSLDLTSGKISAVFALLGSEGNFGIKETADRPLPDLVFPPGGGSGPAGGGARR